GVGPAGTRAAWTKPAARHLTPDRETLPPPISIVAPAHSAEKRPAASPRPAQSPKRSIQKKSFAGTSSAGSAQAPLAPAQRESSPSMRKTPAPAAETRYARDSPANSRVDCRFRKRLSLQALQVCSPKLADSRYVLRHHFLSS